MEAYQGDFKGKLGETAVRLRQAARAVQEVTGLKGLSQAMTGRAERLEKNLFTVALFGAFSAGKSSFANALMGEMVLPVSPNPTTAAINKILPPTETYAHGSVRVKIKSVADITLDVQQSLGVFGHSAGDLDAALDEIAKLDVTQVQPNAKPHFSFLKAVAKGLAPIREHLGHELLVDLKEFKAFVAKEEKACFAEWVELYYDCPLTRQGITLVDTPGADSINARHTGVAFNYIKNADAVLFVTYYNHAFSNADREFLIQLGRVKDTFEMDKMFFLVNAADLAKDEEELRGVVEHVRKNLVQCRISMPRIYPVSSQTALLARLHEKGQLQGSAEKVYRQRTGRAEGDLMPAQEALELAGMSAFEKDFISFTIQELTEIAVQAAVAEIKRGVATLDDLIQTATADESARAEKLKVTDETLRRAKEGVAGLDASAESKAIAKEIDELLYYVKQRVFFRFGDMFKESFNPAVLQEDGRDMKQALRGSLEELVRFLGYDLGQEMRATALRVEKYVNQSGKRTADRLADTVGQAAPKLQLETYQAREFDTPEFAESLPGSASELSSSLSLFKSAKDFFEKNGKQAMQDALEKGLHAPVDGYLAQAGSTLHDAYGAAFVRLVEDLQRESTAQVEEYFAGLIEALSAQVDVEKWIAVRDELEKLVG
ncbi:dynamin family protein [Tumebacillus sp. DT12]|uniref:Dynamin family protein n=1 Tax=Tumebacillus lacus TaxID=2995335 RepID=A0ABT3X928_9BACL|nr:dynamin family protein [Tumebacillus lacus]MCX7571264.1 dynamin family protein [Tumebacillus lacus]